MTTVERLFDEYKRAHAESGDVDPRPFLDQVRELDRDELAALIDGFLAFAPPRPFDAAAFRRFQRDARRQVLVNDVLDDATLTDFARDAGVSRTDLIVGLAERLHLTGHERAVRRRLRDIERGDVALDRVRGSVWLGLADILGTSVEKIRRAAESVAMAPPGAATGYRSATPDATHAMPYVDGEEQDDTVVDDAFFE